jgi:transposase-like protein/predicted RNA-binding Zn-ribbon protein involved in translation (DUF1610 family)
VRELDNKLVPKNIMDFEKMFATEDQCVEYLIKLKYEGGKYKCSICGCEKCWQVQQYRFKCSKCGYRDSILTDTIFELKKKPLTLYFRAIWYILSQKNGSSALNIMRILGLGSYKSAWTWLHKLRRAMVRLDREKLNGNVEIDEAQFGKTKNSKTGRGTDQTKLVIAVEVREKLLGRIRISEINDFSSDSLILFIKENVEIGSTVITDDWNGYNGIEKYGFTRDIQVTKDDSNPLPHVHLIISLLKRWILGTLHGSYNNKYLEYYLDEFVFRFNRRNSKDRGLLFYRLMEIAVSKEPITLNAIKEKEPTLTKDSSSNKS